MREYLRMSEYRKVTISGRCRQSAGKILSANADRRHTQNERGKSRESAHALFCVIQRHVRVYPRSPKAREPLRDYTPISSRNFKKITAG
ncbi:TPA: hypothetical protein DIS55_01685 [Candidatus Kaiserbacteria bacterium]|nr:hypothetical protein [Candidatus Kaiserbacteria bacterium]